MQHFEQQSNIPVGINIIILSNELHAILILIALYINSLKKVTK